MKTMFSLGKDKMIYDPEKLTFQQTHKLMIGSIIPRPIAFVATTSNEKINNIAPFSYFNGVCSNPPTIMFAPARRGWDGKEKGAHEWFIEFKVAPKNPEQFNHILIRLCKRSIAIMKLNVKTT